MPWAPPFPLLSDGSTFLERRLVGSLPLRDVSGNNDYYPYVHSIAASENFVVLPLYPLQIPLSKARPPLFAPSPSTLAASATPSSQHPAPEN